LNDTITRLVISNKKNDGNSGLLLLLQDPLSRKGLGWYIS